MSRPEDRVAPVAQHPRIVYIAGWGRSGSTLVGQILGAGRDAVNVGEIEYIWDRGVTQDNLCGCGRPFSQCPFWTAVGERLGGWDPQLAVRMTEQADARRRFRTVPALLSRGRAEADDGGFADQLGRLYDAVAAEAGARTVVDSSKDAWYCQVLRTMPGFSMRVLHLVRDSRAVAFSMSRTVPRPDGGVPFMPTLGPAGASVRWVVANIQHMLLGGRFRRRARVRYEDFAHRPADTLRGIEQALEVRLDSWELVSDGAVELPVDHGISGNPARFRRGPVRIAIDDQWRRDMRSGTRRVCTAITWPLLALFGYLRRSALP